MKSTIVYYIRVFLYYFFRVFPIQRNKICITNFNGKGYGDNPKYIVEELLRRNPRCGIVWCVNDECRDGFPDRVTLVRYKSIRAIYEEATAKVWIDNCRKQLYVRKRKDQFYIQTWHGGLGLKKSEKDVESKLLPYYVQQAKHDSRLIDILLSNSGFCTEWYKRAFWYNGAIAEFGVPRDDILINRPEHVREKVMRHFNLEKNARIILYAPTFRNDESTDVYDIDYSAVLDLMNSGRENRWVFLVRLHPNVSNRADLLQYTNSIINATGYADMQELMLASDMLITDYSSIVFEFMLMYKPVFLYVKDYEKYRAEERNFYFDLFSLPFPHAYTNSELLKKIQDFDQAAYTSAMNVLFNEIKPFSSGTASQKTADILLEQIQ